MSRVIFKLTFKHPNYKDTVSKNVSHVAYISTRSGVDKTLTEQDLQKELQKGVEDLSSDDETYVNYIDARPRSHGLFGPDGIEDPKQVQDEVSQVTSYVWRSIVSLREDDAKNLGYLEKDKWQDMLRKKIPDMAHEMGIKQSNMRWVAAIHMEKGHPHAHIMFWEKNPERTVGIVNTKTLDNVRKLYTDEIFEEERFQLLNEKNIMRELLNDLAKGDIVQAARLIKEVRASGLELKTFIEGMDKEGVSPRLYSDHEQKLLQMLNDLSAKLPGKGRVALKFMPEDIKEEVRAIADYLLQQPEISASLERNLKAVEEMTRLYTSDEKAVKSRIEQYSYITNNLARNLLANGIDQNEAIRIIKSWSDNQGEDLKVSYDERQKILSSLKLDDDSISVSQYHREAFGHISIKILEESGYSDKESIRNTYTQAQVNHRNILFEKLVEKDLLSLNDGIYSITEKANTLLAKSESLNDIQKDILKYLSGKELNLTDFMDDKHLKFVLEAASRYNEFMLKKYDATIIREYFGKGNLLNLDDFKNVLAEKFKSEIKQNEEYKIVTSRINTLVENNIVMKDGDNYSFTEDGLAKLDEVDTNFQFTSYDANVLGNYFDRAGGELTEDQLRIFLAEDYNTKDEADKQFSYIIKRLDNNIKSGYVEKGFNGEYQAYSLTEKGIQIREEILNPGQSRLKQILTGLEKVGLVTIKDGLYSINEEFNYTINNDILANVKDNVYDLAKLQEDNNNFVQELSNKLDNLNVTYGEIKTLLNMKDITDPISRARENAYMDIRDRICQVILKGAVESQKDNMFYVDPELATKAVDFISRLNNTVNLDPEHTRLLNEITVALVRTGHTDEKIQKHLEDFTNRENINLDDSSFTKIIQQVRESGAGSQDINMLSPDKKVDYYISVLKLAGYSEDEAFKLVKISIRNDSEELDNRLQELNKTGHLEINEGNYKLTDKGIEEFLNVKELDAAEKAIFKMLEADGENIPKAGFTDLLDNKEIFSSLYDKDPEEFKIGKFDLKVREEFGEDNVLTLRQLEKTIYERYTDDEQNVNIDRAEKEYDIMKQRIEKLTLHGYVELDKVTGIFSFTPEAIEALENLSEKMEFTRYDASVTLSYIDKSPGGVLTQEQLHMVLNNEIVNKTAADYYNRFTELLESDQKELIKKYISIDEYGNMQSTEEGKWFGINLNKLNKYFHEAKGKLTDEKIKAFCEKEYGQDNAEPEFKKITEQLQKQIEKGHITKDQDTGVYKIDKTILDMNRLLYQIYKEGGALNKANLKDVLERNVPNQEAERQFKYLVKRLDNLKQEGYLAGNQKEYSLTAAGIEKRADLLIPERDLLRRKLVYLGKLGFVEKTAEGYQAAEGYYKFMKKVAISKEEKIERVSTVITKDIAAAIDRTQDKVDVGKIRRTNERIATGKLINDEYKDIKTDYAAVRSACNVPDIMSKTVGNLATTLLVSGMSLENTKDILQQWNTRSNTNLDPEKLDEIIKKAHILVHDNDLLGKTTLISTKEWKAMFESLGVSEKDTPKWIYKGENWRSPNIMFSIINDIWKSAWRQLERQRMQTEAQADMLKKTINQQQAANRNKEAAIEQSKKSKDRSSIQIDDDREF